MKTQKWPRTILLLLVIPGVLSNFDIRAEQDALPGRHDFASLHGSFVAERVLDDVKVPAFAGDRMHSP